MEHQKLNEERFNVVKLLQDAHNAGLTVEADGDSLRIRGPESAEEIVGIISENKEAVLKVLQEIPDISPQVEELKERLRKGIEWFSSADPHLWDAKDNPINTNSKLETMMNNHLAKWGELERLLRNLYDYEGCIYSGVDIDNISGSCPDDSPVKCSGCE